jgi:cell division septal protein FtsQ
MTVHRPSRHTTKRRRLHTLAQGTLGAPALPLDLATLPRPKILAAGMLVALAIALYAFFDTDYFYVFQFQIHGTRFLTTAEIEQASGMRGYNIFFINAREVERALLKLPEVKAVAVTTRLPNDVVIEIQERTPALIWQRGNETYWVDADGVLLRPRAPMPELPVLRDMDASAVALGGRAPARALAAFWALRAAMPESPRALEWSAARGIAFTNERGWKIYLGDADEMPGKIAVLRALVAQLVSQNAQIRFIDLGKGDPYYQ